jgi:hypothetical protein
MRTPVRRRSGSLPIPIVNRSPRYRSRNDVRRQLILDESNSVA